MNRNKKIIMTLAVLLMVFVNNFMPIPVSADETPSATPKSSNETLV